MIYGVNAKIYLKIGNAVQNGQKLYFSFLH